MVNYRKSNTIDSTDEVDWFVFLKSKSMFFTIDNNKIIDKIAWVLAIDTINIITSTISWNWKHSFESLRSLEETSLHLPKGLAKHPHLLSMGGGNHLPSGDQLTCLSTCIIKEGPHNWHLQTELERNWIKKTFYFEVMC